MFGIVIGQFIGVLFFSGRTDIELFTVIPEPHYNSYCSMTLVDHCLNNPVLYMFCVTMYKEIKIKRKARTEAGEGWREIEMEERERGRRRRIRFRWFLAITLTNNPSLAKLRKDHIYLDFPRNF